MVCDDISDNRHEPHWPVATPSYHLGSIPTFAIYDTSIDENGVSDGSRTHAICLEGRRTSRYTTPTNVDSFVAFKIPYFVL